MRENRANFPKQGLIMCTIVAIYFYAANLKETWISIKNVEEPNPKPKMGRPTVANRMLQVC